VDSSIMKYHGVAYDINKCYSKCMFDPLDGWYRYNELCTWKKFKGGEIEAGLYYVKTKDTTLLHASNVYSAPIVKKAMDEGIKSTATDFDVFLIFDDSEEIGFFLLPCDFVHMRRFFTSLAKVLAFTTYSGMAVKRV